MLVVQSVLAVKSNSLVFDSGVAIWARRNLGMSEILSMHMTPDGSINFFPPYFYFSPFYLSNFPFSLNQ